MSSKTHRRNPSGWWMDSQSCRARGTWSNHQRWLLFPRWGNRGLRDEITRGKSQLMQTWVPAHVRITLAQASKGGNAGLWHVSRFVFSFSIRIGWGRSVVRALKWACALFSRTFHAQNCKSNVRHPDLDGFPLQKLLVLFPEWVVKHEESGFSQEQMTWHYQPCDPTQLWACQPWQQSALLLGCF